MHKVGNVGIFVLLKFRNMLYREINQIYFNFNSKYHDKCIFVVKLISLANTSNLFPLEVVQKCQHCQLCVLRENSNTWIFQIVFHISFLAKNTCISNVQQKNSKLIMRCHSLLVTDHFTCMDYLRLLVFYLLKIFFANFFCFLGGGGIEIKKSKMSVWCQIPHCIETYQK